jgi:HSP20 family protein
MVATLELPGMEKDDINIDVHGDRLIVSGESGSTTETTDPGGYSVRERSFGKFSRTILLAKGTKARTLLSSLPVNSLYF